MKKLSLFFAFLFIQLNSLFAQQEFTFFHMNNVYQSSYFNPTGIPEHKISIGLPGISSNYVSIVNSSFVANDVKQRVVEGDSAKLDINTMYEKLHKNRNYIYAGASVDLFSLRIKIRNLYASVNVTEIANNRFTYPKEFISLIKNGNAQYIGQEGNLDGIGNYFTHYREIGFGLTRNKDGAKFIYGGRVKVLFGIDNIYTSKSTLRIGVDPEYYQNTLTTDFQVKTSSAFNPDGEGYDSGAKDFSNYILNFKNMGFGLDGGITYKASKKLSLTAAVNNLGFISWKSNLATYTSQGSFQFNGYDLQSLVGNDSINSSDLLDSIVDTFEPKITHEKYKTPLAAQTYLSAAYKLGRNTSIAGTLYGEFFKGIRPAASLAFIQRAGRVFNMVATYSVSRKSYNNVGLGVMFKPGPVQFYLVGDNFMALVNPFKANMFNLRFGFNLLIGKVRNSDFQTNKER